MRVNASKPARPRQEAYPHPAPAAAHTQESRHGEAVAPPVVQETIGTSGTPPEAESRRFTESRFGHDFSRIRVHADQQAEAVRGRAYTIGHDIAFGRAPDTTVQRSAIASWSTASDAERLHFLSSADQKKYLKQQEQASQNKSVKSPIPLPQVDKILNLTARYHHYDKYPTPEGGVLTFDSAIVADVQKQFRIGDTPDFWPNIKWRAKDGLVHEIGVRFDISFVQHALDPAATDFENYAGIGMMSDKDVRTHPEDNIVLMRDIDNLSKLGLNASAIVAFAQKIGITNFVYDSSTNSVTYTPSSGGAAVVYQAPNDVMNVIRLVREEARLQHVEAQLTNTTLGYASESAITFDTNKTAPASKTFDAYEPMEDVNDYKSYEKEALAKKTTVNFSPAERRKRLAAVIAHEIGHNIGMGHTDAGIMAESTDTDVFVRQATTLRDPSSSSGTTMNYVARIWEISYESHQEAMTPENVQLLVNRLPGMTDYVLPLLPAEADAQKPDLHGFAQTTIAELKPLLQAGDYPTIFSRDLLVAMMAIPYQAALLDQLVSEEKMVSKDKEVIRNAMAIEGRLTYAGWQQLSAKAQAYITSETLRVIDKSFSGVSFFPTSAERDAY